MLILKNLICFSAIFAIASSASKWYDGPQRPYEFGFKLEGNQHRFEKKDDNGIIMGEFGFITADGVYHITVYATDENGNFKIVSMKNIKLAGLIPAVTIGQAQAKESLAPSPPASPPSVRTGKTAQSSTASPPAPPSASVPAPNPSKDTPKPNGSTKFGCSNCKIPDLEAEKQRQKEEAEAKRAQKQPLPRTDGVLSTPIVYPNQNEPNNQNNYPSDNQSGGGSGGQQNTGSQSSQGQQPNNQNGPQQNNNNELPNNFDVTARDGRTETGDTRSTQGQNQGKGASGSSGGSNTPKSGGADAGDGDNNNTQQQSGQNQPSNDGSGGTSNDYGPTSYGGDDGAVDNQTPTGGANEIERDDGASQDGQNNQGGSAGPVTSGQGRALGSGGKSQLDGLSPNSIDAIQDLMGMLYKFNYTVGYHGHHETGNRQGDKEGGYFTVGRDGLKRIVTYKANEFGFQPYVKIEQAQPEEIPQPDTEKENKRHDYEFKWFFKNE